jgi:hypothetical protein
MRKVKGARESFDPVHGYLNNPDPISGGARISPAHGEVLVSSTGALGAGLSWHEVALYPGGGLNVLDEAIPVNLGCLPGDDGKVGISDECNPMWAARCRPRT